MASKTSAPDPYRILLVEDDLDQAHLLKSLLENEGNFVVTLVQDGLRGSALVQEREWDLVITDLNLPGADGLAVVEASRKHRPDVPILATTGYSGPEYADRARRTGADDVLLKPLDRDDLLTRVSILLTPPGRVGAPERVSAPEGTEGRESSAPTPDPSAGTAPVATPGSRTTTEPRRTLAISVRPGDAEAGCGGILLRHRKRGEHVVVLTLTHGAEGEAGEARREQAKEAGRKMGVRFFVGNAGSGEDSLAEDLERLVRGALSEIRPHLVYVPTRHHTDPSLRVVHDVVAGHGEELEGIFAYDPGDAAPAFGPSLFVPVDDTLDDKSGVLESFDPSGLSHLEKERVLTSARFWARHTGGRAAEALEQIRGDVPAFLTDGENRTDGGKRAGEGKRPDA